jgi:hypothetical protein
LTALSPETYWPSKKPHFAGPAVISDPFWFEVQVRDRTPERVVTRGAAIDPNQMIEARVGRGFLAREVVGVVGAGGIGQRHQVEQRQRIGIEPIRRNPVAGKTAGAAVGDVARRRRLRILDVDQAAVGVEGL